MSTSKKPPVFRKVGAGGDVYNWIVQYHTHFEALGLWEHVQDDAEIEVDEDNENSAEICDSRYR